MTPKDKDTISPVLEGVERPLWSVMIPTYNCAGTLRRTLESVLSQDLGSNMMQIMVVDNCSTEDDPEAVVNELGYSRVEFHRNPQNIGSTRNFNQCINLAQGQLVHILHGDDYVLDGFYQKLQALFEKYPEIGAAFCRSMHVDGRGTIKYTYELQMPESGVLPDTWLEKIATRCCLQPAAMVVRRKVYEDLGGYNLDLLGADDWEMWVRIANQYAIGYEVTCLAVTRDHSKSLSEDLFSSEKTIQELFTAIQVTQSYLPDSKTHKLFQQAKENTAQYSLDLAKAAVYRGKWSVVITLAKQALWLSPTPLIILRTGKVTFYGCIHLIRHWFRDMRKVNRMF